MKDKVKKVKTFVEPSLEVSELRYRRLFEAAQDGILILDAKTGAITDVNPFLIDMLGYSRDEFVDKKLWEVGAFKDIKASKEAFETLQNEKYIRYENLPLKAKDGHLVQVEFVSNIYSVNSDKVIQCNIRDITEHKRAELEVESLSRFPGENPAPVLRLNEKGIILYTNKAGQTILEGWNVASGQAAPVFLLTKIAEALESQSQQFVELSSGARVFSFAITPVIGAGYVNIYGEDITERKRAERKVLHLNRLYATLIHINRMIVHTRDRDSLFSEICRAVVEHGKFRMAWIGLIDEASGYVKAIVFAGEEQGYLTNIRIAVQDPKLGGDPTGTAIREERCIICHDIASDPRMTPWREQALQRGYRASAAVPIWQRKHPIGALTVYSSESQGFSDDDQYLLDEIGQDISYALDSIDAEAERKRVEEALAKEQYDMQTIMDNLPISIYFKDQASRFTRISKSQALRFDLSDPAQAIGKTDFDFFTTEHAQPAYEDEQAVIRTGHPLIKEEKETWVDHPDKWVLTVKMPRRDHVGNIIGTFGISTDITERKQAEEALAQERNLLRSLIDNLPDHIYAKDAEGRFTLANIAVARHMGAVKPDELLGKTDFDFFPPDLATQFHVDEQALIHSGKLLIDHEEFTRDQAGQTKWVLATKVLLHDNQGNYFGLVGIGRDITERKQAEDALAQERNLLRSLIDHVPDFIYVKDTQSRFLIANPALARLTGVATPDELLGKTDFDFFPQELAAKYYADEQAIFQSGQPVLELEESIVDSAGNKRWISSTKILLRDAQGKIVGLVGMGRDITESKQAEEQLRQSENFLRQVIDLVPYFIFAKDKESRFLLTNKANADAYGTTTTDIVGKSDADFSATPEDARHFHEDDLAVIEGEEPKFIPEETFRDIHGNIRYLQTTKIPFQFGPAKVPALFGVAVDITERKQAEETIRQHITELETLYESGLILSQLLPPKEIAQKLIDLMSTKLDWHHTTIRLYHAEDETLELLAFNLPNTISTAEYNAIKERFRTLITRAGDGLSGWSVQHRQTVRVGELAQDSRYIEVEPSLHSGMYIPLKAGERLVGVISIESEMPNAFSEADERFVATLSNQAAVGLENSRLHEETLRHIKRLEALHAIDQSIAGSFNQSLILEILLTHTLDQLEVDAAVVLLLEPYQRTLQYAVGKGFRTRTIEIANYKLSESLARQAIMERRMIHISDREAGELNPALADLWLEEGFKSMDSASLISKGQVKGVLNVYHRKAFTPNPAWSSFLETLAGQAAIAIETTQLFNGLQQANMELAVAYDATIEGWSRAMDLRDKETEGHTERVTEMSMQMGKAMQFGEEYLVQLRRGALLHDIGKLGVPDGILLKADKLTEEEWQIMKSHPQLAYDMLSSVAYLHRALDIPYCHHERWDGTGYPRGLKGEQIPLAARIFAIVDVWDALTSDRPYRKAWSKPDALKYIREQSGKHFDPQVVDIFLKEFGNE